MIQLQEITFYYTSGRPIFNHFSWEVQPGEAWAVLGPSGCGKSTLLYLLAGLIFPSSGKVFVGGQHLNQPRPKTGLILQDYGLLPWATVRQNVMLGLRLRQFYGPDGKHAPIEPNFQPTENQANYWIEKLGLSIIANQFPGQISGGQRQRTAIARTLTLNPDLLLMDEPFASLDAPTRESLQKLVFQLHSEQNITTVIVTHSIEEAAFLGRKIMVLGLPPIQKGQFIENHQAGVSDYIASPQYQTMCEILRQMLECNRI
jgi:ABC-type nitrate/sulfonate/bicarbonate transport system ATPase subunit